MIMTVIPKIILLSVIVIGGALSAQTPQDTASCDDMFILACLGDK